MYFWMVGIGDRACYKLLKEAPKSEVLADLKQAIELNDYMRKMAKLDPDLKKEPFEGPIYTGADWNPDPALNASSAAGWGFFEAEPGMYTLTFEHPTMNCGAVETLVVAGYLMNDVGVVCSPVASDSK